MVLIKDSMMGTLAVKGLILKTKNPLKSDSHVLKKLCYLLH